MVFRKSAVCLAAIVALSAGAAQAHPEAAGSSAHATSAQHQAAPSYKAVAKPAQAKPVRHASAASARREPALSAPAAPPISTPHVRVSTLPTEREIAALFDLWNAALQTGNPELVASLYAVDGLLLPTVSNRVRTTRIEIADYFTHFLALQPRGTIKQQFIRVLSPDLALNAGVYTFDVIRDGKPEQVTARYDFLYKRVNGRWMIADHHSSKMPEDTPVSLVQTALVGH